MATHIETSAQRAESIERVLKASEKEPPEVKQQALNALGAPIPSPTRGAADIVWVILVSGLVALLVLALLGLLNVIGSDGVSNSDKMVTIFTTVLAGLLGLFAGSRAGSSRGQAPAGSHRPTQAGG